MKVFIGLLTWNNYLRHEMADSLKALMDYTNSKGIECNALRWERIRTDIARDNAIRQAWELKGDYLLMLDDDNPCRPDTITKLLEHKKDIVGALIPRRTPPHVPCIFKYDKNYKNGLGFKPYERHEIQKGLMEVDAIGMGCTLINVEAGKAIYDRFLESPFGLINEEYIDNGKTKLINIGEDIAFCRRAKKMGYKIFCDTEVRAGHIIKEPVICYNDRFETVFYNEK